MKKVLKPSLFITYILILGLFFLLTLTGNKAVTAITENAPLTDRVCIVIDAGHGGVDCGAISCTGVYESVINLEIALKLDDLLHLLGMETYMIRKTDISVFISGNTIAAKKVSDLKERTRIVNATNHAVLVSIHQNHFADSRYSGPQVFYSSAANSGLLGKQMQQALVCNLKPGSNRQAKKADGIYLLQNISVPGILIECGFLSNHAEEMKLRDPGYQMQLCCVFASVLSQYVNNNSFT